MTMTTVHFLGIVVGLVGMVLMRRLLTRRHYPLLLVVALVLLGLSFLWPMMYFFSLWLYAVGAVARTLWTWHATHDVTRLDVPGWVTRYL